MNEEQTKPFLDGVREGIEAVVRFCNPSVHDDTKIKEWVEVYYSWYIHRRQNEEPILT